MRRSPSAFTLLELLVVISIIAVLASLMMPAIGMVRELAKRSNCLSRMHLIAAVCVTYATDNEHFMPGTADANKYHGYHFRPTEPDVRHDFGLVSLWLTGYYDSLTFPVCPGGTLKQATVSNGSGATNYYWRQTNGFLRYQDTAMARMALMVDMYYYIPTRPNHRGGLNILFGDGSAHWLSDPTGVWSNTTLPAANNVGPVFGKVDSPFLNVNLYFDDQY